MLGHAWGAGSVKRLNVLLGPILLANAVKSFALPRVQAYAVLPHALTPPHSRATRAIFQHAKPNDNSDLVNSEQLFGGFTAKQRLREEIESPFRTFRLAIFSFSTASALLALYFSAINTLKASMGGFPDAPTLESALTSDVINVAAVIGCGLITYRDLKSGDANLARIAKGGALAKLSVSPSGVSAAARVPLSNYRRGSRILIAAGGPDYLSTLARSLTSDQLSDQNDLVERLAAVDVVVVPVLLETKGTTVGDARTCWLGTEGEPGDKNFDITRGNEVVAFPSGTGAWAAYLADEVATATTQGFDVINTGFTITVKKNGRILRRATGQPQWGSLIGAMEVMDGKFGMPGDTEKYGS